jgi:hypothetical protein
MLLSPSFEKFAHHFMHGRILAKTADDQTLFDNHQEKVRATTTFPSLKTKDDGKTASHYCCLVLSAPISIVLPFNLERSERISDISETSITET